MQRYLRPENCKNMIAFIDDLHMPMTKTKKATSTSLELLRDFMITGGWHITKGLTFRRIFDTFIFASATDSTLLSKRLIHHFTFLGLDFPTRETIHSIFKVYCDLIVIKWGSDIQQFSGKICDTLVEFYSKIKDS
jgi:hypothetical protein